MECEALNDRAEELLTHARNAGVVLDYMTLAANGAGPPAMMHEEAAATFLRVISAKRGLEERLRIPVLAGRQISIADFYGWHFDRQTRRLRLPARGAYVEAWRELYQSQSGVTGSLSHELGFGPYRWADDEDPNNAIWVRDEITCAYAHAFVDPPYSVRIPPTELEQLFLAVDEVILHSPRDDSEIWWWEGGDWAEYFLPGLEWWGAWVCTLRLSATSFVAIGASSSD